MKTSKIIIDAIEKAVSEFKQKDYYDEYEILVIGARVDPAVTDEETVDEAEDLNLEVFVGANTSVDGDGDVRILYQKFDTFSKNDSESIQNFVDIASHFADAYEENFYVEVSELASVRFFTTAVSNMSQIEYLKHAVKESAKDGWIYGGIIFRIPIIL